MTDEERLNWMRKKVNQIRHNSNYGCLGTTYNKGGVMPHNNVQYVQMVTMLAQVLMEKSYKEGHFVLASGKESDYYFDCRITSLSAAGSKLIGNVFFDLIEDLVKNDAIDPVQGVAGMTMGADPLVTAVTYASSGTTMPLDGMLIRKQPKDHGTNSQIEGTANLPEGSSVFMLEDVITTGGSILKACKVVEAAGYKIAGIGVILDREEGGRQNIQDAGYKLFSLYTKHTLKDFAKMNIRPYKSLEELLKDSE